MIFVSGTHRGGVIFGHINLSVISREVVAKDRRLSKITKKVDRKRKRIKDRILGPYKAGRRRIQQSRPEIGKLIL